MGNPRVRRAFDAIEAPHTQAAIISLASEFVRARSVNPSGDTRQVAELVAAACRTRGMAVETVDGGGHRHSVMVTTGLPNDAVALIINGHLDTVPAEAEDGWTTSPYSASQTGTRLVGRGTADAKGAIAAAIVAAGIYRESEPTSSVALHFVADEESGGKFGTALTMARTRHRPQWALVLEPTELRWCTEELSSGFLRAHASGIAGHASRVPQSSNPIAAVAEFVTALHDSEYPLQAQATMVNAGSAPNVVPARCDVIFDLRWSAAIPASDITTGVRAARDAVNARGHTRIEIDELGLEDGFAPDERIRPLTTAAAGLLGMQPTGGVFLASSDGRILSNQYQIPTIVVGPGALDVAHSVGEYVEMSALHDAARHYLAIMFASERLQTKETH